MLVGSCLCHSPTSSLSSYFIVNGQCKVIVSQERLINNHPLISVCAHPSARQVQYNCDVRSVPVNNPHRYPVVFSLRVTQSTTTTVTTMAASPQLQDPIIVDRLPDQKQRPGEDAHVLPPRTCPSADNGQGHDDEVPVSLLFFAYGYLDPMLICRMIAHTASSFSPETIRRLLYVTFQHTTSVRTQAEALAILSGYMQQQQQGTAPPRVASGTTAAAAVARGGTTGPGVSPVEDLLSRGSLGPAGPPVSTRERPASSVQQCPQDGIPC